MLKRLFWSVFKLVVSYFDVVRSNVRNAAIDIKAALKDTAEDFKKLRGELQRKGD